MDKGVAKPSDTVYYKLTFRNDKKTLTEEDFLRFKLQKAKALALADESVQFLEHVNCFLYQLTGVNSLQANKLDYLKGLCSGLGRLQSEALSGLVCQILKRSNFGEFYLFEKNVDELAHVLLDTLAESKGSFEDLECRVYSSVDLVVQSRLSTKGILMGDRLMDNRTFDDLGARRLGLNCRKGLDSSHVPKGSDHCISFLSGTKGSSFECSQNSRASSKADNLLLLSNKFLTVKSLNVFLPKELSLTKLNKYALVLLSLDLLFHSLFEVVLDLKDTASLASDPLACGLVVLFSFAISKFKALKSLHLSFNSALAAEISDFLKIPNSLNGSQGLSLLDFFLFYTTGLIKLSIRFNCLEAGTFQKIQCLVYKNPSIGILQLRLFPDDSYLCKATLKLLSQSAETPQQKKRLKSFIHKKPDLNPQESKTKPLTRNVSSTMIEQSLESDDDEDYLDEMLPDFQANLEMLYFTISALKLIELQLDYDIPAVLIGNEKYLILVVKFTMNLINRILNCCEPTLNGKLSLKAKMLEFDCRKFPFLADCLEALGAGKRSSQVTDLTLHFTFSRCLHLANLLDSSLRFLDLRYIDYETFKGSFLGEGFSAKARAMRVITIVRLGFSRLVTRDELIGDLVGFLDLLGSIESLREIELDTNVSFSEGNWALVRKRLAGYRFVEKWVIGVSRKMHQILEEEGMVDLFPYERLRGVLAGVLARGFGDCRGLLVRKKAVRDVLERVLRMVTLPDGRSVPKLVVKFAD